MGHFATGVTVVTTDGEGGSHAMTANSVTSLSLDPPLLLVAVNRRATMLDYLHRNGCFAVNILRSDHEELSRRFAVPGPKTFDDLDITRGATGSPILAGAIAHLDCRVQEVLPGGDHEIFVGRIVGGACEGGEPLLYYGGRYRRLAD